ncbi:3-ketoacyl-CoA thiolase [Mycolicibacterium fortuitum]|uniref:3-ketoacyl-CoA thiolase n=1 Tax=Mycolicibacterium fortuitum TaxID=1766 RepID=A0A0N9Y7U1_MYCFO|nr:acetyl-CoA C-acyltransferase [Mycolicibacterium fortuitum]ALI25851.1 3-ketoacyl-CoA thiolase [Mycolicibacterium fortuitum]
MRDAIIAAAVRTPLGKRRGALSGVHPVELSSIVLEGLRASVGLDPNLVDDVIWGCVSQVGEQAANVGRYAVLGAGWPETIPATTIDRQCGSSQQAVHFAAAGVVSGQYDVVIAGGVESMTRVPMGSTRSSGVGDPFGPGIEKRYGVKGFNQGVAADLIANQWGFSRGQLDEFSLQSHARAATAQDEGRFEAEIVAVPTFDAEGNPTLVTVDEGVRRGGSLDSLTALAPAFGEDGLTTAASSSQISDGAAALLVTTSAVAAHHGWKPLARLHTFAVVGVDPVTMLTGPIPATMQVLEKANMHLADVDTFEVNEAFASVALAWLKDTGADPDKLNPNGGAIALGHPLGGSGARLMTTMVHRLVATGGRWGLQTMCEGGGMANATLVERV